MGLRHVHDLEMFFDEDSGEITIRRPGWRTDPTKIVTFFPGAGSGQGFPLIGNTIDISIDNIMSVGSSTNPGINVADDYFNIGLNGQVPNGDVDISMSPNADGTGKSSFVIYTKSDLIAKWQDDNGTKKYGVFDKAISPNVQPSAVTIPVDLPTALIAIEEIIIAMKSLGHMEDPV
jgi:hypothetical protein